MDEERDEVETKYYCSAPKKSDTLVVRAPMARTDWIGMGPRFGQTLLALGSAARPLSIASCVAHSFFVSLVRRYGPLGARTGLGTT